jgi:hypothetical protein
LPFWRERQPQYPQLGNPPVIISQPIAHRILRVTPTDLIWARGFTIYDGLVGVVDSHFENYVDQPVNNGTRKAAALTINGVGDVDYVWGGTEDPWRVDPRNYTSGLSFTNVALANKVRWPVPRPPVHRVDPSLALILDTMGWIFGCGLNEVVVHDLDGTLAGSGLGRGYVMNANSPLLWRNGSSVTQVFDSTNTHIWSHMPDSENWIAALQIELPWDYVAAQAPGVTTFFRNMKLALPPPQQADSIDLYDMDAAGVFTLQDYADRDRVHWPSSKRLFGTNVPVAHADSVAPPQYDLSYQNLHVLVGSPPDAWEFAVRLRFGEAGGAMILKLPKPTITSPGPTQVFPATPPPIGTLGATHSVGGINSYPHLTDLYKRGAAIAMAPSRAALDTASGIAWFETGNDLFIRLELIPRTVAPSADPVYTGSECIVFVKFHPY